MGISCDALCAKAIGGLMAERYWQWSLIKYNHHAADEIEETLTKLLMREVTNASPVYLASPIP